MFEVVYFSSLLLILFAYLGYPITLVVVGFLKNKKIIKQNISPSVSFIITVYNEEKNIENKILNTLALNYTKQNLQIIVTSDGSTDNTNVIVQKYKKDFIELVQIKQRKGKENAQKEALKKAKGDIIVFSDAATILGADSLKEIVSNFADESIGCVSSIDRIMNDNNNSTGEGIYIRYEMWLRELETKVNSVVGLSGSFFAARKEVCVDFAENLQSDFRILLNSIRIGLRGISDSTAIAYYQEVGNEYAEFQRKVRTVLRGITVFFNHIEFLNFTKYGFFSFQLFTHKLLRWLVPLFLVLFFINNCILMYKSSFFLIMLIVQLLFYFVPILGLINKKLLIHKIIKIPSYFIMVNISILVAWIRYFRGDRLTIWKPSVRSQN